jgi:hypothetical protein
MVQGEPLVQFRRIFVAPCLGERRCGKAERLLELPIADRLLRLLSTPPARRSKRRAASIRLRAAKSSAALSSACHSLWVMSVAGLNQAFLLHRFVLIALGDVGQNLPVLAGLLEEIESASVC